MNMVFSLQVMSAYMYVIDWLLQSDSCVSTKVESSPTSYRKATVIFG